MNHSSSTFSLFRSFAVRPRSHLIVLASKPSSASPTFRTMASSSPSSSTTAAASTSTLTSPSSVVPPQDTRQPIKVPIATMEESIRSKLETQFDPTRLEIRNDSSKHAHHAPMKVQGAFTGETHFFVHLASAAFQGKNRIARHRLVNTALADEFARGLHALSLKLEDEDGN